MTCFIHEATWIFFNMYCVCTHCVSIVYIQKLSFLHELWLCLLVAACVYFFLYLVMHVSCSVCFVGFHLVCVLEPCKLTLYSFSKTLDTYTLTSILSCKYLCFCGTQSLELSAFSTNILAPAPSLLCCRVWDVKLNSSCLTFTVCYTLSWDSTQQGLFLLLTVM